MINKQDYPIHSGTGAFQEAWTEAYCTPQKDPHGRFAELTGMSRHKAKEVAYSFMWSDKARDIALIQMFQQVSREGAFIYKHLSKMLTEPVPNLTEILKEMN